MTEDLNYLCYYLGVVSVLIVTVVSSVISVSRLLTSIIVIVL